MLRIGWRNIAFRLVVGTVLLPAPAPAHAADPVKSSSVVSVVELNKEATSIMERLAEYLGSAESYTSAREERLPQAAGLLACVAQALADHPDRKKSKIAAASLRNATVQIVNSDSFDVATASYALAKQAMNGMGTGTSPTKTTWENLVSMEVSMKVMESRSNRIRRGLRRFRHPQREIRHAVALSLLGQAMRADTESLDSPEEIAKWKRMSDEYLTAAADLATAMRNKDKTAAQKQHARITRSCKVCHDVFRDN